MNNIIIIILSIGVSVALVVGLSLYYYFKKTGQEANNGVTYGLLAGLFAALVTAGAYFFKHKKTVKKYSD